MAEQGETYAKFIEAELKTEMERRASLDARGLGIVTSSTALITLMFSLSVLITGKDYTFGVLGQGGVVVSLLLFIVAGVLGIAANQAREYEVTHEDTLYEMLGAHWTDDEVDARNTCAYRNVVSIQSLRRGNESKAEQITWALFFQVAAITALAISLAGEVL